MLYLGTELSFQCSFEAWEECVRAHWPVTMSDRNFQLPSQAKPYVTAHLYLSLSFCMHLKRATSLCEWFLFSLPARDECDWDLRRGADAGAANSGRCSPPGKYQLQRSWQLCGRGEWRVSVALALGGGTRGNSCLAPSEETHHFPFLSSQPGYLGKRWES